MVTHKLGGEGERDLDLDAVALLDSFGIDPMRRRIEELDAEDPSPRVQVNVQVRPKLLGALDDSVVVIDERNIERVRLCVIGVDSHVTPPRARA